MRCMHTHLARVDAKLLPKEVATRVVGIFKLWLGYPPACLAVQGTKSGENLQCVRAAQAHTDHVFLFFTISTCWHSPRL